LQVDRAHIAPARHPVIHAAVLAWVWVIVVFAPMGATLHALKHLRPLPHVSSTSASAASASAPFGASAASASAASAGAQGAEGHRHIAAADEQDGVPHRAPAHCHGCDAWQFFDHILPVAGAAAPTPHDAGLPHTTAGTSRAAIETPWILPRAPPSRA
jgi:hypothetical protein